MISLEEWVDIISLHRQGVRIKAIARKLNVLRNAVRRAIRRDGPPAYERPQRPSKLDPFKDYLVQRLSVFSWRLRPWVTRAADRFLKTLRGRIAYEEKSRSFALRPCPDNRLKSIGRTWVCTSLESVPSRSTCSPWSLVIPAVSTQRL